MSLLFFRHFLLGPKGGLPGNRVEPDGVLEAAAYDVMIAHYRWDVCFHHEVDHFAWKRVVAHQIAQGEYAVDISVLYFGQDRLECMKIGMYIRYYCKFHLFAFWQKKLPNRLMMVPVGLLE